MTMTTSDHGGERPQGGDRRDLADYAAVLWSWRRFLLFNTLGVALLVLGIMFLFPNRYRSVARIIPPKQPDVLSLSSVSGNALRGLTGGLGGLSRMLGNNSNTYNYLAILKSRTASEEIVGRFNLTEVYDTKDRSVERAVDELEDYVDFEIEPDDFISVSVLDKEPQRAADMANAYVEILNRMSIQLAGQEARSNREFIEHRLRKTYQELDSSETLLKLFQEKSGFVINPTATGSQLSGVVDLYVLQARKEIEIGVLERSVGKDHPQYAYARLELQEIRKKLANMPAAGVDAIRLYRDILIQQRILEFIVPLYEQAKVDENRSVPVLLVLDSAVPAERKATPKRGLVALLSAALAATASVVAAFLLHGARKLDRRASRFHALAGAAQDWLVRTYRVRD